MNSHDQSLNQHSIGTGGDPWSPTEFVLWGFLLVIAVLLADTCRSQPATTTDLCTRLPENFSTSLEPLRLPLGEDTLTLLSPAAMSAVMYGLSAWEVNSILAYERLQELSVCDSAIAEAGMVIASYERMRKVQEEMDSMKTSAIEDCSERLRDSAKRERASERKRKVNSVLTSILVPVVFGAGIGIGVYIAK